MDPAAFVATADGRLAALGLTLHRTALTTASSGWLWALTLPAQVDKAVYRDREHVWSSSSVDPPDQTRRLLAGVTGNRALVPIGAGRPLPTAAGVVRLDAGSSVAEVLDARVDEARRRLLAQDVGLRIDDHPEFVHQARVAVRTLRSDLRTFRTLLEPGWVGEVRAELRWVATALGAARDLDVLAERLILRLTQIPPAETGADDPLTIGGPWITERLTRERQEARRALREVLDTTRYLDILAVLEEPVPWVARADGPAREAAGRLVRRPWRRLARSVAALGQAPTDGALHQVRLRTKQVRYAAEALAPAAGPPAQLLARRAKALQSVLGDHQDAVIAEAWLRAAGRDAGVERTWLAGQVALLEAQDRHAARGSWPQAWAALNRRSVRRWLG